GRTWLRVPETIRVELTGTRPPALAAKDVGLAMIGALGAEGANYQSLEFHGPGVGAFTLDERMVLSNLSVEAGGEGRRWKAAATTGSSLSGRAPHSDDARRAAPVSADSGALYSRELRLDLSTLSPGVAIPHDPTDVVNVGDAAGVPVHMVFLGTCTGGRVSDFHEAVHVLERAGGRVAPGVQLVLTPASREVLPTLVDAGTPPELRPLGGV